MSKRGLNYSEFQMNLHLDEDIIEPKDILITRNGYKILITYALPYYVEGAKNPYWSVKGKLITKYVTSFIPQNEVDMINIGYYEINTRSKKLAKIMKKIKNLEI